MGNKIVKGILAVIIVAAILVGIYFALPGSIKYSINEFYQTNFDEKSEKLIKEYKSMKAPGTEKTFEQIMAAKCKSHNWYVETIVKDSTYKVHLNGYKVDVIYPKEDGSNNQHFTNTHIEYTFDVTVQPDGTHKNTGWHFLVDGNEKPEYDKKTSIKALGQ